MADITRRRTGEHLRALFEVLRAHPDGMNAKDALEELSKRVVLTPHEEGSYAKGGRRFEKIVRFATVDCVKAGWMVKSKGVWTLTDDGLEAHAKLKDPEAFYREAIRLYKEWHATQPREPSIHRGESGTEGDAGSPDLAASIEEAEEQSWQQIEAYLDAMPPYDFQHLVGDLLRAMGYHVAWIAPPGKDGGVDVLAFTDPLGTTLPRIKVQVKRQKQSVSVEGLRAFMAVLASDDVGIFVNTGGFTRDAEHEARTQASRRVTLVDMEKLFELWVEHYSRLTDTARQRMPLRPVWFLAPME